MKYNININQLVLSETILDLVDCSILDWMIIICSSKSSRIEQQRIDGWTWIDYSQLLRDMPLLRIKSKGALTPRIKKIRDTGFIETDIKTGDRLFIRLTDKVDSLFLSTVHSDERYRSSKRTPTVHENEHIIILDNHNTKLEDTKSPIGDAFALFWSAYPKKELKKKAEDKWKSKKLDSKIQEILDFIERAKQTDRWKKGFIKAPPVFLGNECWNDDLESYKDKFNSRSKSVAVIN